MGGYQVDYANIQGDELARPCPVARTSIRDNNVIANCGFGIGEQASGNIGLWTYFFDDNDVNTVGQIVSGVNAVDLPSDTDCVASPDLIVPAVAGTGFVEYSPPSDWPIVPQVCGDYD